MADELSTPATGLRLWLLHGVNLDMLGQRDPAHYGSLTLDELEHAVTARGLVAGLRGAAASTPITRASSSSGCTASPVRARTR